jgi:hypothetical protein
VLEVWSPVCVLWELEPSGGGLVGSLQVIAGGVPSKSIAGPQPWPLLSLPGREVSGFVHHVSTALMCCLTSPKAAEPMVCGLEPLKLWAKINLFS